MVTFDKDKLNEQIRALGELPQIKEVRLLRDRLQRELERLTKQEIEIETTTSKPDTRSSKLKKYHRYLRMIRDNFPNLKYSQIRKQFAEKRKGQETDIPDAIWQNPSP